MDLQAAIRTLMGNPAEYEYADPPTDADEFTSQIEDMVWKVQGNISQYGWKAYAASLVITHTDSGKFWRAARNYWDTAMSTKEAT